MATIDENGAQLKTFNEYKEEVEQSYLAIDSGWNINPESQDGQAIAIWSELLANLDEAAVASFQSIDRRTAIGVALDRIGALFLLPRKTGTFSTATVDLTGVDGSLIPAGTKFRNSETGTLWNTDADITLVSGSGTVNVTCEEAGEKTAAIGEISIIATPVNGLSTVTNTAAAAIGDEIESDAKYRNRQNASVGATGNNQVDSIYSSVASVNDVSRVRIYENSDTTPDSNNVNRNSLAIIVQGGSNSEIAAAIAAKKNPGCNLNRGNVSIDNEQTVETETPAGNPFTATFFRPLRTSVFVEVTINGTFDSDAIKQAIVDYANGELLSGSIGFDQTGFEIGDSVPAGKLYTPVNKTISDSAFVESIFIGTSPSPTTAATISIPFNGLAVFDVSQIEVISA